MYDFLNTITFLTVYWMCEAHLVNFAMKFKLGDWLFFRDFCNSSVCKWFDVLVLTILCSCMANWLSIAVVKSADQSKNVSFFWGGRVSSTIYAKRLKPCFRPIFPPCRENVNFQHSVSGICYTALCYDVIRDVLVLYTFHLLKWKLKWFCLILWPRPKFSATSRFAY